ncbi:XopAG/AvrGf1 family type III secretion system effector [Xanthomonas axonopodis]|uniref:XopAG/AvrGf1 family type III secretion system effector n=1 Tax=Xanthomonas axonopodis TaxID=53413 RepID=UPI0009979E0D|nr:XopAG/AvrGf1 family type III secretion system effector [Xanthomonas axonopodis]
MRVAKNNVKPVASLLVNEASKNAPTSAQAISGANSSNEILSGLASFSKNANRTSSSRKTPRRLASLAKTAMKYVAGTAGAAYVYDNTANRFFLSTTSLHDGKQGFTSDARLQEAEKKAEANYAEYHAHECPGKIEVKRTSLWPKLVGENAFVTMLDFRSATKVHTKELINTKEARDSIALNISCILGERIKPALLTKHGVVQAPADFDITKQDDFEIKNKYSLSGVPNNDTGSYGYASRSISNPFIEKGEKHHAQAIASDQALTPKACVGALQPLLENSQSLIPEAQFRAGQALLILRPLYCGPKTWGDAHKVLMPFLERKGLASPRENQRLGETRPFTSSDMEKGVARRNTSVAGPLLHELNMLIQKSIYKKDEEWMSDLRSKNLREMSYIPISHFKMNDDCTGFEDSSGLADSFTGYNVAAYINHARLLSGEDRLSKRDVVVLVGCLNAVYDNASSERHTLREIAHGCFVGAGYTVEDAEAFYKNVCKNSAREFYGGEALIAAKSN